MNEVLNEDIKAANMLARQIAAIVKNHGHKYDRTFASAVKSINKDSTYTIMDDAGAERKVKCSLPNAALKTGQYVWVKVPCGRLEDMHICGLK
ncbi:MAG: hypothetical protein OSJ53_04420 [Kineothrix sp.]|nr:hypothetical protein [Kineothrix sp.]